MRWRPEEERPRSRPRADLRRSSEIGNGDTENGEGLDSSLAARSARVLAALENIPNSELDAKAVCAELDAKDAALRETAWWIAGRHPQWGEQLAGYFRER